MKELSSKSVQSPALPLESIDNIKCCHCLTTSMLSVGDCIPDHILQEHLEDTSGLLIDQARNTLDTSSTGKSPDCWLGDSLDVVSEHLPVPLGSSLSCGWHLTSKNKTSCVCSAFDLSSIDKLMFNFDGMTRDHWAVGFKLSSKQQLHFLYPWHVETPLRLNVMHWQHNLQGLCSLNSCSVVSKPLKSKMRNRSIIDNVDRLT